MSTTSVSPLRSPLRSLYQTLLSLSPTVSTQYYPFSTRRKTPGDAAEPGAGGGDLGDRPPKIFVVQPRLRPDDLLQAKLSEALNLANSLEEPRDERLEGGFGEKKLPPFSVVQNPLSRSRGCADTYFGRGTVENVKCQLNAMVSEDGTDAIFVNAVLSGVQQRNLERAWGKPVLDRIGLIIEIFNAHAQTKEAKLQSELAALMYKRTRLVRVRRPGGRLSFGISDEDEVVSAKGKGSGGRGFLSGAGESEIQLQRGRIQERRDYLLREIEEVRRTRALQRYARRRCSGTDGQGLATVAVVGYTNAGKSTLVSALSQKDLYRDDRLFATVDPRLRSVILPSGRKVLLSDTVGFISDLPVQLVEAFHATLEEVVNADLLVHVIDSCAKNLDEQQSAVLQVLKQIGVSEEKIRNMIEVWNKIDLVNSESGDIISLGESFNVCNDEEGSSSDQGEISLDGSLEETIDDCWEAKNGSHQFSEGNHLEDGNEDIESYKQEDSFRDSLFSEVFAKDSDAVGHRKVTIYGEDENEGNSQVSLWKSEYIDDSSSGSSFENPAVTSNQKVKLCGGGEIGKSVTHPSRVETSAVTRVGLQELLYIIDEKLSAQQSLQYIVDHFDRKWRPSYSAEKGNTVT